MLFWRRKDKVKNPQFYRPHGLYVFSGLYGSGKTISMVRYVDKILEENPNMLVYANFDLTMFHSRRLNSISEVESLYNPNGIIFVIDEAQLTFNARDYAKFPWEMVSAICQNRKEGKMLVFASQNFYHVDKQIRDLVFRIVHCHSFMGLYFQNKWYDPAKYDKLFSAIPARRPWALRTDRFIGYPALFNGFHSFKKLEKMKVHSDKASLQPVEQPISRLLRRVMAVSRVRRVKII